MRSKRVSANGADDNASASVAEKVCGVVRWFNRDYGFISGLNGEDVFVHYSNIVGQGFRYL